MKSREIIAILGTAIICVSCGGSTINTPENNNNDQSGFKIPGPLPRVGIVFDMKKDAGTFNLSILPEETGNSNRLIQVDFSSAHIINSKGAEMGKEALKDSQTVKVDGSFTSSDKIKATTVEIESEESTVLKLKDSALVGILDIPEIIRENYTEMFPANFGEKNWIVGTKSGKTSKIFTLEKNNWNIVIMEDPKTESQFEVTVSENKKQLLSCDILKGRKLIKK